MDLGVRDWMIIVGVLLILAVLLDGYRRVRNERRGKIRMALNRQFLNAGGDDSDPQSSELPNGGARVVGRRSGGDLSGRREPQLGNVDGLELDQSVPLLMESVVSANLAGQLSEPDEQPAARDLFGDMPTPAAEPVVAQTDDEDRHDAGTAAAEDARANDGGRDHSHTEPHRSTTQQRPPAPPTEPGASANHSRAQEIIVINVIARDEPFQGADLLHILLACDLRFGKMNIFHRHEQANGRGQVQFSVANSVEPGTFNLDRIDDFSTPGVCFFMSVPGPEDPITAFECMVETAQCLVKNLDGEMRDESRSAMTMQTLEHCRQRLQEFERRQLAQA